MRLAFVVPGGRLDTESSLLVELPDVDRAAVREPALHPGGVAGHEAENVGRILADCGRKVRHPLDVHAPDLRLEAVRLALVAALHRAGGGHPAVTLGSSPNLGLGLVGSHERRPHHDTGGAGGDDTNGLAGAVEATVRPDLAIALLGRQRALADRGELRDAVTRLLARDAHRSGPDADLDDVGPRVDERAGSVGGADVASDDRHISADRTTDLLDGPQHADLMAVRRVDHDHVGPVLQGELRAFQRPAIDPDRHRDHEPPVLVEGGAADDRGEAGAGLSENNAVATADDADHLALRVDHGGGGEALLVEEVEDLGVARRLGDALDLGAHHLADRRGVIALEVVEILVGDHAHGRATRVDDDDEAVPDLVHERTRLGDRHLGRGRERLREPRVSGLDGPQGPPEILERDILREDTEPTALRDTRRHAPPGDGVHVRGHDQVVRTDDVVGLEVDVATRAVLPELGRERHVARRVGLGTIDEIRCGNGHGLLTVCRLPRRRGIGSVLKGSSGCGPRPGPLGDLEVFPTAQCHAERFRGMGKLEREYTSP